MRDRKERRLQLLPDVQADARYGLRMMRKSPGFSAIAVLTLALGIGANTAIFGIVYGLLFRPLPFPDEAHIAMVHMNFAPQNNPRGNLSIADFVDWQSGNTVFERVAAYSRSRFTLTGDGQAEQVAGAAVTADFFSVLGLKPTLGRAFQAGDDSASGSNIAVISASLWHRRFGGSRGVIGRVIQVDGNPTTIVGVIDTGYDFPLRDSELWQTIHLRVTRRGPFFFQGIARLRPGMTLERAQAETNVIGRNIERANPGTYSRLTMPVESLRNYLVGDLRPALLMMFAAVGAVLLIATVNIANLLLARASTRQHEVAVRLSLGAGHRRLIQQLLTESVLLSLSGAAVGLLLAFAGLRLFQALNPADVPLTYQVRLDWSVFFFTIATSIGVGVLFGLVPAIQSVRMDLQSPLKEGGRSGVATATGQRTRSALVVAETALALALLVASGLLLRSFIKLQTVDAGFSAPPQNLLTMLVTLKTAHKGESPDAYQNAMISFYRQLTEGVARLPGIQYAAISDSIPPDQESEDDTFSIAGRPWSEQAFPSTTLPKISPDYFRTLGVPLVRGRFFTPADTAKSPPVTLISQSLAQRYFADADPLGKQIQASSPGSGNPYMDIVGVVGDLKYWGLEKEAAPAYYQPYTQNFSDSMFLVVRSAKPAAVLGPMIQREIHGLDKDAVVRRVLTMEDLLSADVAQPRYRTLLLTGFGTVALLLAAIGIYGVMAYSVTQRTQEIGIRMALGAQRGDVLKMVLGRGALLASSGIVIGILASFAIARGLSRFLYAITVGDPLTFLLAVVLLSAVAMAATLIPAVRATRIDPLVALRYE